MRQVGAGWAAGWWVAAALVLLAVSGCGDATDDSPAEPILDEEPSATTEVPESTSPTPPPTAAVPEPDCARVTDFARPDWFIVNDGVMGGRSEAGGQLEGSVLVWTGTIQTAGGGFSSIRGPVGADLDGATSLRLRIRTDGRRYEFLASDSATDRQRITYYTPVLASGGGWETVEVSLTEMEARIFGTPVLATPFVPGDATQIGIILADGVDGDFTFEIDWIDACA